MISRILVTASMAAGLAAAQSRAPVIVELFTSEGCDSCPPADSLLARLPSGFNDVDVIPLSEHVDYWNHLGWQDRFSSPLFSARQQDYGRAFRLESVYTPQMVINGEAQLNGADEASARQQIRKAAQEPKAAVQLAMQGSDVVRLKVDHLPQGVRGADMFLAITETNLATMVRSGENAGRRLRHTGVVRSLTSVGYLDTKKAASYSADARVDLDSTWRMENVRLVLFVQDRSSRKIVGAAVARP